jgi:hypothetical protein
MKKISNFKIKEEHLMVSLVQSLVYWLAYDLESFLSKNSNNHKAIMKKIGKVCKRKGDLTELINILTNIDPEIECELEKEKIDLYTKFSLETGRRAIRAPIIDFRSEDVLETLLDEEEEFEANFLSIYKNLLEDNDPGNIFIDISESFTEAIQLLLGITVDDEEFNIDLFKKFGKKVEDIRANLISLIENQSYVEFLINEISRIETANKDKEDSKYTLVEGAIEHWDNIFNKSILYCDRLIEAIKENDTENILEVSQELEWINLSVMYSSFYLIQGYFSLSRYSWVTIDILSVPPGSEWDHAI